MTDAEKREQERLALEASRLTNDETLKVAVARIRQGAVDALITADPTVTADIIRFQAKVTVCDEFMAELDTMIQLHAIETGSRISG
jgi:hypothetical protein